MGDSALLLDSSAKVVPLKLIYRSIIVRGPPRQKPISWPSMAW